MSNSCANCQFYKGDAAAGTCRRHAPAVFDRTWTHPEHGMQTETSSEWPWVANGDWCGDHTFINPPADK